MGPSIRGGQSSQEIPRNGVVRFAFSAMCRGPLTLEPKPSPGSGWRLEFVPVRPSTDRNGWPSASALPAWELSFFSPRRESSEGEGPSCRPDSRDAYLNPGLEGLHCLPFYFQKGRVAWA